MCSKVSFTTITADHLPMPRYFAVTHGRCVQVWDAPGHSRDFAPFSLLRSYPGQYDNTMCIEWSEDSRCVCVCVAGGWGRGVHVCTCMCAHGCLVMFVPLVLQFLCCWLTRHELSYLLPAPHPWVPLCHSGCPPYCPGGLLLPSPLTQCEALSYSLPCTLKQYTLPFL